MYMLPSILKCREMCNAMWKRERARDGALANGVSCNLLRL